MDKKDSIKRDRGKYEHTEKEIKRQVKEERGEKNSMDIERKLDEKEKETLRIELESLSKNEEFARVAVAVFMSRLDPTMEEIDDVKTAVSEAVTNAVIHGYQGKAGIIYIEVTIIGQELTIIVKDTGIGIVDIKKAMEPMFTTDRTGERSGMGFSFMEAFMDNVQVISAPNEGTEVIMNKRIGR